MTTLNTTSPLDTDDVKNYPSLERTFRAAIATALGVEHDIVGGSATFNSRHKFGIGNNAARDAITDWVVGSIWFNTTSGVVLQVCTAVGPVVWSDASGAGAAAWTAVAKSANYTVLTTDSLKLFKCSNSIKITLPAASTLTQDHRTVWRNVGTGIVELSPTSPSLIDSVASSGSIYLRPGESLLLMNDGTDYFTQGRPREEYPEQDIASASTTDLGTIKGESARVTGTTTITSFGTAPAGTKLDLRFAGALILTHNATSLILPNNGSNITTVAGDRMGVLSLGSGNWEATYFQRASGQALQATTSGTAIVNIVRTVYASGATWSKNAALLFAEIEVIAGGGGGGGVVGQSGSHGAAAGGGGQGGKARVLKTAASLGATETVTIGAAGSGGNTSGSSGGNGGTSSFGAHASATGGTGGSGMTSTTTSPPNIGADGGPGGAGTAGDVLQSGQCGEFGVVLSAGGTRGGVGGNNPNIATDGSLGNNGSAGSNPGDGGNGAANYNTGGGNTGGAGVKGQVIVTEYRSV